MENEYNFDYNKAITPDPKSNFIDEVKGLGVPFRGDDETLIDGKVALTLRKGPGSVEIKAIRSSPAGEGHGSKVMLKLSELADKHGVQLSLLPSPLDRLENHQVRPAIDRLIKFYKRFGFRGGRTGMIRKPQ